MKRELTIEIDAASLGPPGSKGSKMSAEWKDRSEYLEHNGKRWVIVCTVPRTPSEHERIMRGWDGDEARHRALAGAR